MPTIRQLLDRYGLPPRELALDWAWQIRGQLDRDQLSSNECLLRAHVWTDLEVAADGRLLCECLDSQSAITALEDLSHWAGSEAELVPSRRVSRRRVSPRLARVSESLAYVGAAAVLLLIAVGAWLFSSTSPEPVSSSNTLSTTETSTNHSNSADSESDSVPAVSQLESLSLVDPGQPVAMDESSPPTNTSSLGQLSVDTSIAPPLSPLASKEQPEPNPVPSVAVDLTASPASSEPEASSPSAEALRDVQQAMQKAEAEESIVTANRSRESHNTHGDPWVLSRDTMRYRATVASELKAKARDAQWTLALEPIEGLAVEPQRPVTIQARGLAVWRIFEADAKPPRSCLFVRAVNRGREGQLELVFCGGAEDMPGMSVPLAPKWLEPLTVRVQSQAVELRGALARLSTTVITPDQVPAVMQRKQAMLAQMFTSSRLGVIMPEINRLAQLVDGQVTMHAALKSKPNEPALATWGQLP